MKSWMVGVLSLVCIAFVLVACSSSGSSSESEGEDVEIPEGSTEVVMWNLFGGGDADYMQEIVDKYNDSQDEFFINNVQQDYDDYYTKLLTSLAAGKGPDIAVSHAHALPELIDQGLIEELDSLGSDVGVNWEDFNQNILEATIFEDQHYAIPIDTHAHIMYINNKLVDEAGLLNDDGTVKMEETPEGFREFFTTLKQELPDDKMPLAFSTAGIDSYRQWWAYYSQLGGEHIVTEDLDNPKYVLDTDKAIQAAEELHKLWYEDEVVPLNLADFYSEFQSGNAAAIATGVWATGTWESTDDLDFTAMPLPNIFGQKGAWGGSHTLVIPYYQNADADVQKGALEFMDYATDQGAIWAKAGHIPAKDTVVESSEFKELPYREDYAEVANDINFADQTIYARGIMDLMERNLDLIWTNEATPEEAFQLIEKEIKDLIGE